VLLKFYYSSTIFHVNCLSMTVRAYLRTDQPRRDGTCTIYLQIIHNRMKRYRSTGIVVNPDHWDERRSRVKKSHPLHAKINRLIENKLNKIREAAYDIQMNRRDYHIDELLAREQQLDFDFMAFFEERIDIFRQEGNVSQTKNYGTTYRKVKRFLDGDSLPVERLTSNWLYEFQDWCRMVLQNKQSTVNRNLKVIRRTIGMAIERELMPPEADPFRLFKFTQPKATTKAKLSVDQVKSLHNITLNPGTLLWHVRNYFLFMIFAKGMRISDLIQLTWDNIDDDHIVIIYQKTARQKAEPVRTLIIKPLRNLLELYGNDQAGPNHYIFPILPYPKKTDYNDDFKLNKHIKAKTALINKYLKKLAHKANIDVHLTTHVARHTFLNLSDELGIPARTVMQMANHSDFKETESYMVKRKQHMIDQAHQKFEDIL